MTPDERAELALPCFGTTRCKRITQTVHHDFSCPAFYRSAVAAQIREAVAGEREAIAQEAEDEELTDIRVALLRNMETRRRALAAAIRARGEQETGEK